MSNTAITPYLFYNGRCEEAIEFYRGALQAEVEMLMRFSESPDPVPEGMLQPGFENKVMHASVKLRGISLLMSDGCHEGGSFGGFRLALTVPTEADAHTVFEALSQGGTVEMPLTKTFWSPCFGMATDRFGLGWMVMVEGK